MSCTRLPVNNPIMPCAAFYRSDIDLIKKISGVQLYSEQVTSSSSSWRIRGVPRPDEIYSLFLPVGWCLSSAWSPAEKIRTLIFILLQSCELNKHCEDFQQVRVHLSKNTQMIELTQESCDQFTTNLQNHKQHMWTRI